MRQPYDQFLDQLRGQLLGPLGKLSASVRRDIMEGRLVEGALNSFVVRVRANAPSVTQGHIDELKASGLQEDEIFDAAVCAAFVAGEERFGAAMKALEGAGDAS
jgi:alkylhydroperoxidase family enzyme